MKLKHYINNQLLNLKEMLLYKRNAPLYTNGIGSYQYRH